MPIAALVRPGGGRNIAFEEANRDTWYFSVAAAWQSSKHVEPVDELTDLVAPTFVGPDETYPMPAANTNSPPPKWRCKLPIAAALGINRRGRINSPATLAYTSLGESGQITSHADDLAWQTVDRLVNVRCMRYSFLVNREVHRGGLHFQSQDS